MPELLNTALWLAGAGHFAVLAASFQVPRRMQWRTELARLSAMNRKLMWTYGGFTVLTIMAFGVLTLYLRQEMVRGDRAALSLAAFIAVYWSARIAVDIFYFGHAGWPRGRWFVAAHAALLSLFLAVATTYMAVLVWHLRGAP